MRALGSKRDDRHDTSWVRAAAPRSWAACASLIALLVVGMALLGAGCGVTIGPTQVLVIEEPLGGAAVTNIELDMGAGKLNLAPGSTGLVTGQIRYNVESWKPTVERSDSGVKIKQGSRKSLSGLGADIVNEWQLQLGSAPMRLDLSAGAYEGSYDLSGLVLQELTIKDGAFQMVSEGVSQ